MVVERIKEARYSFYNEQFDQVSQEAKDFIAALLQKSPEFRLTASNALLHPWIKTLVQVGENSWPMAKLNVSRLKTFNARRKWHVSVYTLGLLSLVHIQFAILVSLKKWQRQLYYGDVGVEGYVYWSLYAHVVYRGSIHTYT